MTTPVWIGLGSNLGDRELILRDAVAALSQTPEVIVRAVSSFHETQPVGGPPGQGPFLNAAARLETSLDPYQLLGILQGIETQAGRVRTVRWGERTLDLDILIFGTKFLDDEDLKLPHPRLAFRRFVLAPLAEIASNIVDTTTMLSIAELLANLDREPRLVAIHGSDRLVKRRVFRRLVEQLPGLGITEEGLVPPGSPEGNPYSDRFLLLETKCDQLKASPGPGVPPRSPWFVTDYWLDYDLLGQSPRLLLRDVPGLDSSTRYVAHREALRRLKEKADAALKTTLVVILPEARGLTRQPRSLPVPPLHPDATDPDAIVDEVLATCRAITTI